VKFWPKRKRLENPPAEAESPPAVADESDVSKRRRLENPPIELESSPTLPVQSDPFGLRVLHNPVDTRNQSQQPWSTPSGDLPLIDVIFVHGLGGSSRGTWTHPKGGFWPTWLQEKRGLENLRISTFGYDANWNPTKRDNGLGIADFARNLLMELKLHYTTSGDVYSLRSSC
jgi:hypothetical protein